MDIVTLTPETWDRIADWIRTHCYGLQNAMLVDDICHGLLAASICSIARNQLQNGKSKLYARHVPVGTSRRGWFVCSTLEERDLAVKWYQDRVDAEITNCEKLKKAFEESCPTSTKN